MPDHFRIDSFYDELCEKFYLHSEFEVYMIDKKRKQTQTDWKMNEYDIRRSGSLY